ncbi:hypothetical protein IE53DRAFT_23885 [Violaceomyces palustris]|uniref:Uncharacterized protein n=1 Tax=Violaceomyces palustris TaxID=1673888 RepID=A0ACD0P7Q1_9BASI|nr:hypothetical protein IE53DRAFT_23885 [Violaceomyces palustris]
MSAEPSQAEQIDAARTSTPEILQSDDHSPVEPKSQGNSEGAGMAPSGPVSPGQGETAAASAEAPSDESLPTSSAERDGKEDDLRNLGDESPSDCEKKSAPEEAQASSSSDSPKDTASGVSSLKNPEGLSNASSAQTSTTFPATSQQKKFTSLSVNKRFLEKASTSPSSSPSSAKASPATLAAPNGECTVCLPFALTRNYEPQ